MTAAWRATLAVILAGGIAAACLAPRPAPLRPGAISAERRGIGTTALPPLSRESGLKFRRSLAVTDVEILEQFTFKDVMETLAAQAGPGVTALSLFQAWWRTQDIAPIPRCPRPGFTFPYCGRDEKVLARQDPFADPRAPEAFVAIGLFNRIDLADQHGKDCGEYRIVFARRSGLGGAGAERVLLNFEAIFPNPSGTPAGCAPIARFWRDLGAMDDWRDRAAALREFYLTRGVGDFGPVVHIDNYGARCPPDEACATGQIRTNQFMAPPWVLGEFIAERPRAGAPVRGIVPRPVAATPHAGFFCCAGPLVSETALVEFRTRFAAAVPALAATELLAQVPPPDPRFSLGRAVSRDGEEADHVAAFDKNAHTNRELREAIARALPPDSRLTPRDIVVRAQAQSCSGCHHLNNAHADADLRSLGFEHVSEVRLEPDADDGRPSYAISPALTKDLERRARALATMLTR